VVNNCITQWLALKANHFMQIATKIIEDKVEIICYECTEQKINRNAGSLVAILPSQA